MYGMFEMAYSNETTVNNLTSQVNRFLELSASPHFEPILLWNYVEISYNGTNLTGVNESALRLWEYNDTTLKWKQIGDVNATCYP